MIHVVTAGLPAADRYARYLELRSFVGWSTADEDHIRSVADQMLPHLGGIVEQFYQRIEQHPRVSAVIRGGAVQVTRLKGTLTEWLTQLVAGPYDRDYVERRWRVGWRHVEIGLDQAYTNVALSCIRRGIQQLLDVILPISPHRSAIKQSFNTLLDLDLAIMEDAYQAEYLARQTRIERLAAIGQVGGGIAHELRNPLNVIKTSVYYLLNARSATPEKRAEHLERIERHVALADGVITALANFARMPLPESRPVSLPVLLSEVLETTPLPAAIRVVAEWPSDFPPVMADGDQLRIVFANLIRNAREAMPQGGALTLRGHVEVDAILVMVEDTGIGIPPDQLPYVMEPLFTTKARGLGLGLSLARAILEKNRGRIQVTSQPGQGTTFTVRFAHEPGPGSTQ